MKRKQITILAGIPVLIFLIPAIAFAQLKRDTISAYHKTEIIALFKSIDPSKYRIEFKYTGETYGMRRLSSSELEQISKTERLLGTSFILNVTNATIIRLTEECLIYGYSPSRTDPYAMRRLLGQEKTEKLKSFVSFYIPDPKL